MPDPMPQVLYDADVLGEDSIRFWYSKGSSPKGRNVFLKVGRRRDLIPSGCRCSCERFSAV